MKLFKCTNCKTVEIYDPSRGHAMWASLALLETEPGLAIYSCGKKCSKELERKMESGEIREPNLTCRSYYWDVTRPQKGYKTQPSQAKLKQEYNVQNGKLSR